MYLGNSLTVPNIINLPGQGGGGSGAFEYTAIDNSFSMRFDGVSGNRFLLDNLNSVFNNVSAFTIGFWSKFVNPQSNSGVIFENKLNNSNVIWIYRFSGLIYFHVNVSGSKNGNVSAPAVNTWTHIAMVFDGSGSTNAERLKVYYNGVEQTLTYGGTIPATTGTYGTSYLGSMSNGTNEYNGYLDEVGIWSLALSENTIQAIYDTTANNPGKVADLSETPEGAPAAWYRMGD
tara:strand:+ start:366 stop:1061 length:696 start_codon:yes stop_codon:yes gene_type:complete